MNFSIENPLKMFRLLYVLNLIGTPVLYAKSVLKTAFKFVCGESSDPSEDSEKDETLCDELSVSVDNLFHLFPEISNFATGTANDLFRTFHDFSLETGIPAAAVLMSQRKECRRCGKPLQIDQNWKSIVVYHLTRGTYLGCHLSKKCSKCKVYEHYGFFTENGQRTFDSDCLNNEFLMSTDETAIDMMLLKYVNEDIIHRYSHTVDENTTSDPPVLNSSQEAKKRYLSNALIINYFSWYIR
jgi:hypothetical protein